MSACTDEAWDRTLMAIFAVDAASVAMNPNPSPTIPPMTTDMTSWNKQQSQYEISVGKHSNPPQNKRRIVDCRLSESAEECPKILRGVHFSSKEVVEFRAVGEARMVLGPDLE